MEESEEDYWGSSQVQKSKKKANMFDDRVTIETAADFATFRKNLVSEEENPEEENWDGTPVSQARTVNSSSQSSTSKPLAGSVPEAFSKPTFDPDHYGHRPSQPAPAYMTHNRSRSDVLVGSMNKMSLSKTSSSGDYQPSGGSSEPSIDMLVGYPDPPPGTGRPRDRQAEEIAFLRRQLELAESGAVAQTKLKVADTVKRMVTGKPFSLEAYKSKAEKLDLLDRAIKTHDGNAIIAAVMFLKRTVNDQIFNMELTRRPVAVDQYLAYLRAHYNLKELEFTLGMLNRTEEIAMLKFKQAVSIDDPLAKMHKLNTCLSAHFDGAFGQEHNKSLIQQQVALLGRQRPVEVADDMSQKEGKHIGFRANPRVASIINMPVITTLYYCCFYHYDEPENILSSPAGIRKEHMLTEKQFVWTALRARAKLKQWKDVDALFTTKGWLGGTKMRSVVGFDKVCTILHKSGATQEVLAKYLKLVDDVDRRLELACKMPCHKAVIETFLEKRDRRSLEQYQSKLKLNSQEWYYAKDVLNSNATKWKT